jgi:histidinol-phosphate aminotransferase
MNDATSSLSPRPGLPTRAYTRPADDPGVDLWLDANEGPRANARRFASAPGDAESLRRYPDERPLRGALAARFRVAVDQVALGAGADELLDRVCRAYLCPGRALVAPAPCFAMLPRYGQLAGADLRFVPWPRGPFPRAGVVAAATADANPAVVFLTSPNNPTGLSIPTGELLATVDDLTGRLVVVDLAYGEFLADDPTAALLQRPHVLVLRTFSKGYGLAGLRVGYAVGTRALIAPLLATGSPFPNAGPALALAQLALELGPDTAAIAAVAAERQVLAGALAERGFEVLPSDANFVFARAGDPAAARAFAAALQRAGILIRTFPDAGPDLQSAMRITCPGDAGDFARLLAALPAGGAR